MDASKSQTFREMLAPSGASVAVHLDPRAPGAELPAHLRAAPSAALLFTKRNLPPDLVIGSTALRGTLTFRGVAFPCVVPWAAVYALVPRRGDPRVWRGDVPAGVRTQVRPLAAPAPAPAPRLVAATAAPVTATRRRAPVLRVLPGGK